MFFEPLRVDKTFLLFCKIFIPYFCDIMILHGDFALWCDIMIVHGDFALWFCITWNYQEKSPPPRFVSTQKLYVFISVLVIVKCQISVVYRRKIYLSLIDLIVRNTILYSVVILCKYKSCGSWLVNNNKST